MKKLIALTALTTISFSMGIASAQDSSKTKAKNAETSKVKASKKTTRQRSNPTTQVNTSRVNPSASSVGGALDADLVGSCYKLNGNGGTKTNYKAVCAGTRTDKLGKRVDCTGNEDESSPGRYGKYTCQVFGISGNRHFEIRRRSGPGVDVGDVVDMACGCGRDLDEMTCSGGLCSISN